MARMFLYICTGLLVLAFSYRIGANTAVAQGAGQIVAGTLFNTVEYAATADGRIYNRVAQNQVDPWGLMRTVPVTSPVVGIAVEFGAVPPNPVVIVSCADGTVFECDGVSDRASGRTSSLAAPCPRCTSHGDRSRRFTTPRPG